MGLRGNQRRAFLYVDDAVDAIVAAWDKGMGKGVIQIGPSESHSIAEIAEKIVNISGKDIEISYDNSKPEGDMDRTADWSKAKKILRWCPKVLIHDGLRSTYEWSKKTLDGVP